MWPKESRLALRGTEVEVVPLAAPGRITLQQGRLLVPTRTGDLGKRVQGWLRETARADLAAACDRHAAAVGRRPARLTLRDPRTRWGSCTQDGALMFSWRLIMAPAEVLDYVALHEMAHLVEMNHSRAFWSIVERAMPDYKRHRDWLKRQGGSLHRYRF